MKRFWIGTVMAVLLVCISAPVALARGAGGCRYTDADGDGVCDFAGSGCRYTDADGDEVCDFAGSGCRYTDTDGDGVCDFTKSGCRYTDADGDGICDRCGRVPGRWLRRESGAETRDTVSGNGRSCSGTDSGMPVGAGNGFRDPAGRQNGFGDGRNR